MIKEFNLWMGTKQVLPLQVRGDPEIMSVTTPHFQKFLDWRFTIILFSVISRTLVMQS